MKIETTLLIKNRNRYNDERRLCLATSFSYLIMVKNVFELIKGFEIHFLLIYSDS